MKNKKAERNTVGQQYREQRKVAQRKVDMTERAFHTIDKNQKILIYCEGKNTEPSYFSQFRLPTVEIVAFGEGKNTLSLVRRAIELSKAKQYDQVWCVFDADPDPNNSSQTQNFNNAIQLAEQNGFRVAYSNQAFEYWLILHIEDH
jgi:hypothetical protein